MKQELEKTIQTLLNDPMFAITVANIDASGKEFRIVTNFTNTDLVQKYGSAKDFFESLYKSGIKKIKVYPKKQNGYNKAKNCTNFKNAGLKNQPFEIEFEAKENAPQNVAYEQPIYQVPNYPVPLNGNASLGGADYHKIYDYQRVQQENADLKAENKLLISKNETLKEENLRAELLGVKKAEQTEAQAKLLAGASPFIPLIQALLMGAKGQNQEAGAIPLNQGISQLKQWFLNQDESLLQDLLPIIKGMEIPECDAEIQELLLKHNLIVQNNAS